MTRLHYRYPSCLWTACLALSGLAGQVGHAAPGTPPAPSLNLPDAFLPVQAQSVPAVVAQVQADPVVRRHYARYLHLPPARVASYLRANLVPSRLSHEGQYTVYYVRPNGLIYPTVLTVAKGSPVFALRNGPALLTWNEGNPLVRCQKAVQYVPNGKAHATPAFARTPGVEQVIVPTRVETTVVPPPSVPGPIPVIVEPPATSQ